MKSIKFDGQLKYNIDAKMPVRRKGEALIKVILSAVCNTDIEITRGYKGFNGVLGHEFVGVVEEADNSLLIGKRVVGDINIGCGSCEFCRRNEHSQCVDRKVLGIHDKDGAFAEYITLPEENLYVVPDIVTDTEAVYAEPLAAAIEIIERNHIKPTSSVAIIGNGKLGRSIAQIICLTGCKLTIIGRNPDTLADFNELGDLLMVKDIKDEKYDMAIECTGNKEGLMIASRIIKARGKLILKSTYNGAMELNPTQWVVDEIEVVGSRCGPMDAALRMLERGILKVDFMIGETYSLQDYEKAFNYKGHGKAIFDLSK